MGRSHLKPVLSAADYLALLNQRLRAHPMYLEGMAFPLEVVVEEEGLPLAAMVGDTRWDAFGVFASVIDEVGQAYELGVACPSANQPAALVCRQRPGASKAARLRQVLR